MRIIDPWEREVERKCTQLQTSVDLAFYYLRRDTEREFIEMLWLRHWEQQRSLARALLSPR